MFELSHIWVFEKDEFRCYLDWKKGGIIWFEFMIYSNQGAMKARVVVQWFNIELNK